MKQLITSLCVTLAACHSAHATGAANANDPNSQSSVLAAQTTDAEPVSAMLKQGKPEACAHPSVKAKLLSDMRAQVDKLSAQDYALQGVTGADLNGATAAVGQPAMSDFQALEANNAVGEITCGVHVEVGDVRAPIPLTYVLRPSLENEQEFLIAYPSGGPEYLWSNAIVEYATKTAAARKEAEVGPEPQSLPLPK